MESKLRRFLVLLATVVMLVSLLTVGALATGVEEPVCYEHGDVNDDNKVDVTDAIRVLYFSMFPETNPVNQDCDFNKNGNVDHTDAIWLLWASMDDFFGTNSLNGTIHSYYAPTWKWNTENLDAVSASVTFKCGCGTTHTFTAQEGVTVSAVKTEATCTDAGSVVCQAKVTFDNQEYTDTKTVILAANGHDLQGEKTCEQGRACVNCDYVEEAAGHSWTQTAAASCKNNGVETYTCGICSQTKTVTLEGTFSHSYELKESKDVQGSKSCEFIKQNTYACTVCGDTYQENNPYEKHVYKVTLTKEASCVAEGVKTFRCTVCGHSYEESVAKNGVHVWNDGVEADGVITYTCTASGCGETKTAVSAKSGEAVDKTALKDVQELQLGDAAVKLDDQVKNSIQENVAISVETKTAQDLDLSAEQKAQVGDNKIYDFTMTVDGNAVSEFDGEITVSLPYTLQDGDDVDCIDVWFIGDNGKLEIMKGTYSNGFVTFTTDHFSYYTVTRLKPAERCAIYGHMEVTSQKPATCTEDGYVAVLCQRCGQEVSKKVLPMLGHKFTEELKDATCTEDGYVKRECGVCGVVEEGVLPATGHQMKLETVAATCTMTGADTYICTQCDYNYTETLPQLTHQFQLVPERSMEPTCDSAGYSVQICELCGAEEISDKLMPLGHSYTVKEDGWKWAADHSSATVELVCAKDATHTKVLEAVVTRDEQKANCLEAGSAVYTATASWNKATFTDTTGRVELPALGHKPDTQWTTNVNTHYHICKVCKLHVAEETHTMKQTVTMKPTCGAAGAATNKCEICGYSQEEILPATGNHTYNKKNVCTVCGHKKTNCEHLRTNKKEVDLTAYDICGNPEIFIRSCDCGESTALGWDLQCHFTGDEDSVEEMVVTLQDGTKLTCNKETCTECGLSIVYGYNTVINKTNCTSEVYILEMLVQDGKTIAQSYFMQFDAVHPSNTATEQRIDLSQYGMCGEVLVKGTCYCGKSSYCYTEDEQCHWNSVDEGWNDTSEWYKDECVNCGAIRETIFEYGEPDAKCNQAIDYTRRYSKDGKVVYECKTTELAVWHDHTPSVVEQKGDSCEDGVIIAWTCQCGDVEKDYYDWHDNIFQKTIDLSKADICMDALVQWNCACGKSKNFETDGEKECIWNETGSEDNVTVYTCEICNATQTITRTAGTKDKECKRWITDTVVFRDKTGKVLATVYNTEEEYIHNEQQTGKLLGETCMDGVEYKLTCKDCGKVLWKSTEYDHIGFIKQAYDISAMNACATTANLRECLCGSSSWVNVDDGENWCSFEWHEDGDGWYSEKCRECGLVMKTEYVDLEKIDSCHVKRKYTITLSKDDAQPLSITYERVDDIHAQQVFSFSETENCEDGYELYMKCLTCGVEEDWGTHYGHSWWPVKLEVISEGQLCGTLIKETSSCACGAEQSTWTNWRDGECEFEWTGWDEKLNAECFTCSKCGAVRKNIYETTPVEGETCKVRENRTEFYFDKAGNELFTYESSDIYNQHNMLSTFEMYGESCDDGYTVYQKCLDCGEERTRENMFGCDTWMVASETVCEADGICGPVGWENWRCPCGKENYWEEMWACDWDYQSDYEQNGKWYDIFECTTCGLQKHQNSTRKKLDGLCVVERELDLSYYLNEELLGTTQKTFQQEEHETVASFELLGKTCADGYYVTHNCINCDYSRTDEELHTDDSHWRVGYIDLKALGMCDGHIEFHGCACGEERNYGWNMDCRWENAGVDPETGLEKRFCRDCGTTYSFGDVGERNPETCRYEGTFYLKIFTEDGEKLIDSRPVSYESHSEVVDGFELMNPDGDCEDGYYVTLRCEECGRTWTHQERGHAHYVMERVDMAAVGACGGWLEVSGCACGKRTGFWNNLSCENWKFIRDWEETDEDGIAHYFEEYECQDCGISRTQESYRVFPEDQCYGTAYEITTFTLDDWSRTFCDTWDTERHDYQATYALAPGSESCLDGVIVTQTCSKCDYYEVYESDGHHPLNLVGTEDLAQYGAICGSTMEHFRCPCGEAERYGFTEDSQCDLDELSTELWITDAIDNVCTYSTEGNWWIYSDAWTIKCAVTDPEACGLSIRMAEYWLKEGCEAVEYQTWQLGYDDKTGTYQKEITVATGARDPFHNYTVTTVEETLADGTRVSGTERSCPDCESYYNWLYYYDSNGTELKYTLDAVNTLNDGRDKEYHKIEEYGYQYDGDAYETLDYYERTRADGSIYWSKYVYTYDFENGCDWTSTYSSSDGDYDVSENTHYTYWTWKTTKQPTCTQHGVEFEGEYCRVCDAQLDGEYHDIDPTCHENWYWDDEKCFYICADCGLENVNGASGEIVMEDLTDDYGGANYVVGYWNRGEVKVQPHVSVILKDIDGDNQFALIGINFDYWTVEEEGVRALAFSASEAQAAAQTLMAEMGYTGSYAIRISFVPVNGDDTLDYAITFDSLMAA